MRCLTGCRAIGRGEPQQRTAKAVRCRRMKMRTLTLFEQSHGRFSACQDIRPILQPDRTRMGPLCWNILNNGAGNRASRVSVEYLASSPSFPAPGCRVWLLACAGFCLTQIYCEAPGIVAFVARAELPGRGCLYDVGVSCNDVSAFEPRRSHSSFSE